MAAASAQKRNVMGPCNPHLVLIVSEYWSQLRGITIYHIQHSQHLPLLLV